LLVSGARQERVGRRYALEAGTEIHLKAGEAVVIEGVEDLTLAGPGGFIRIDHSGVTIKGRLVKINSGSGTPGVGSGAAPAEPEQPVEAAVPEPAAPQVDDVSRTGVGQ
jgi:type VI secretion system secreted protein VgrG